MLALVGRAIATISQHTASIVGSVGWGVEKGDGGVVLRLSQLTALIDSSNMRRREDGLAG